MRILNLHAVKLQIAYIKQLTHVKLWFILINYLVIINANMAAAIGDSDFIRMAAPFMGEPRPSRGAIELACDYGDDYGEQFFMVYAAMTSIKGLFKRDIARTFARLCLGLGVYAPFIAKDIPHKRMVTIAKKWGESARTIDVTTKEDRDRLYEYQRLLQDVEELLDQGPEWTEGKSCLAVVDRAGYIQAIAEYSTPRAGRPGFVYELATAPKNLFGGCRGAGTAAILGIFLRNVSKVGCVALVSTLTARPFYEKLGFEQLSETSPLELTFEKGIALWARYPRLLA